MPVELNQFIFGNSLVNFAGGSTQSNVPYWLDHLAEAGGNSYAMNGGYGFLRQFADRDEPGNEWGVPGVDAIWDNDVARFDEVSFNSVMIAPGNFIQNNAPDADYAGDTRSPLDAMIETVREVSAAQPGAQVFIYEGWADMDTNFGFPLSTSELQDYHAFNGGAYHDWFVDLTADVNNAVPGADVQLIPVASTLSALLSDGPLAELGLDDLYVDGAPHGTETLYFLASMVVYPAVYGEALPDDLEIPSTVHPVVIENFVAIATQIETTLGTDAAPVVEAPVAEEVVVEAPEIEAPVIAEPIIEEPVNSVPQAAPDAVSVGQDEAVVIDVLSNDSDADGNPLELISVGTAQNGTVTIVDGAAVYMPDAGYSGGDVFDYVISDGQGGVADGTVEIAITAADPEPGLVAPPEIELEAEPEEVDPDPAPDIVEPEPEPEPEKGEPVGGDAQEAGFAVRLFQIEPGAIGLDDVDFDTEPTAQGTVDSLQYLDTNTAFSEETGEDDFAALYDTTLSVTDAGTHEFFFVADDALRIFVDGDMVADSSGDTPGVLSSVALDLSEGAHQVQLQYLELSGTQSLHLDWNGPSTGDAYETLTGTVPDTLPDAQGAEGEVADMAELEAIIDVDPIQLLFRDDLAKPEHLDEELRKVIWEEEDDCVV